MSYDRRYGLPFEITRRDLILLATFVIGSLFFLTLFFMPVEFWWPMGPDNVPLMLQDATLIVAIWTLYPAITILILLFLIFTAGWRIARH